MKKYYDVPTQVQFYDEDNNVWLSGIAYGDVITCGECGGTVELSDLDPNEVEELPWIDIDIFEAVGD